MDPLPLVTRQAEVAAAISEAAHGIGRSKPIMSVFMGRSGLVKAASDTRVPTYRYPEDAAVALGHAVRYGMWRDRPKGPTVVRPGIRSADAAGLLDSALERGGGWLAPDEVAALLAAYGAPGDSADPCGVAT